MSNPYISVLISVYKKTQNLHLILESFSKQSEKSFELIVCEDDRDVEIARVIDFWKKKSNLDIKHVSQEDIGFRKNKILNAGIKEAVGTFVVFIDGDCIPHRRFIESYRVYSRQNFAMHGRRVMLSEQLTNDLLARNSPNPPRLIDLLITGSRPIEHGIFFPWLAKRHRPPSIWGCNWGIAKSHLIQLNGFDEDYVKAGVGEDLDIEWRLLKMGVKLMNLKQVAILYHLHHKQFYSNEDISFNMDLMQEKISLGHVACLNGLEK